MARARYKHLVDKLAAEIRTGERPPGTQLPTHRQLAAQENVALVTASRVYTELESMGLVSGETGRGTFVRETRLPPGHGIDQQPVSLGVADLNFNSPSMPGQAEMLRTALRQLATAGDIESLLHYQPHAGRPHERATIALHLEKRGLSISSEQLVIVSGAQQGLATATSALLNPGDIIATDELIYPGFKAVAELQKLELVGLPATPEGPDLSALETLCRQRPVKAIYTMPTLHNPLGWVMTLEHREALIRLARQYKLWIIEDAAYAFHAQNPPPPLAALAADITLYISGFSKSIATGLRVGYIAAPPHCIPALERVVRATSWNTPALMTALVCGWINDGTVDRLEADKRADARQRQLLAREILAGLDYTGHPNAYFIWLNLPGEVRADRVVTCLLEQGVSVSAAEPFSTSEHPPHALRLALGSVSQDLLREALLKVRQVIESYPL